MEIRKARDLTLINIDENKTMVIACDSCGGIGMKERDIFKVPPFYVGKFTVRVALFEVLCSGAEVITITNTVCCEMDDTGFEIIRGIKEELVTADIEEVVLTGSTEENFKTVATGLGITVVGIAENQLLRVNNVKKQCNLFRNNASDDDSIAVISIGLPKVGGELDYAGDNDIANYSTVRQLLNNPYVYEIVPGGSKGIKYEAELLADNNNLKLQLESKLNVDIEKSCGPATCLIAAVKRSALEGILSSISNVNIIGSLVRKKEE